MLQGRSASFTGAVNEPTLPSTRLSKVDNKTFIVQCVPTASNQLTLHHQTNILIKIMLLRNQNFLQAMKEASYSQLKATLPENQMKNESNISTDHLTHFQPVLVHPH